MNHIYSKLNCKVSNEFCMWNKNILMKKNSYTRVTQTICSLAPIKDYGLNYGAGVWIRTLDFNPGKVDENKYA